MSKGVLEICVDQTKSALVADNCGADRIELCGNLCIGGTTPSESLFEQIRRQCNCPIHVLIRPRFGDFCYSDDEKEVMLHEIGSFVALGADGIVTGALNPNGRLDKVFMEQVRSAAKECKLTLHRAFDMAKEPLEVLQEAIAVGVDTILTSGQQEDCVQGLNCLQTVQEKAGTSITIMAGGGVTSRNLNTIHATARIDTFHMSGKRLVESPMKYRKENVHMGLPGLSEYTSFQTDPAEIEKAVKIVKSW